MSKLIPLTKGLHAIVDDEDYEWLAQWAWYALNGHNVYAARCAQRKAILMHRVLLQAPNDMLVDHINGNPLDNRRANLRLCTHAENMRNSASRTGASQFKGVWKSRGKVWRACIKLHGKSIHLGSFTTEEAAALAYDEAAIRLHGQFAKTNFKKPAG